jgi:NAD(P)-dependent dehydrogenase (short-subunit alcohol dehydrogenase family)
MRISYFTERTVLITGASAGIGYEFARQLAPVVSTMVLVARRNDRLEALKSELKVINPELELFSRPLDLRDKDELERFCDWLDQSDLAIDLLINNAGLGDHGLFVESEWERVNSMLQVNVYALTYLTFRVLPAMRKARCGADPQCEFDRQLASFAQQCGVCRDESVRDQFQRGRSGRAAFVQHIRYGAMSRTCFDRIPITCHTRS